VAALEGYFFIRRTKGLGHRLFLGFGGALMIKPGITTDLIGIALLALGIVIVYLGKRGKKGATEDYSHGNLNERAR